MKIIKKKSILIKKGDLYDLYDNGKLFASNKPNNSILVLNIDNLKNLNNGIYYVDIIDKTKDITIKHPILEDDNTFEVYLPINKSDIINIK